MEIKNKILIPKNMSSERRTVTKVIWTAPFVAAVTLPQHAHASALTPSTADCVGINEILTNTDSYIVPAGVSKLLVTLTGAKGSDGEGFDGVVEQAGEGAPGGSGGFGAVVKGIISVSAGDVLNFQIGTAAVGSTPGTGYGNGGAAGSTGGSGGGASSFDIGGTLMMVAGGGGGGGNGNRAFNGTPGNQCDWGDGGVGGNGGNAGASGTDGMHPENMISPATGCNGGNGTNIGGGGGAGSGGTGGGAGTGHNNNFEGAAGAATDGGVGGITGPSGHGGGGGGGFGGGGGGADGPSGGGGGGGGGGSFANSAVRGVDIRTSTETQGSIRISCG